MLPSQWCRLASPSPEDPVSDGATGGAAGGAAVGCGSAPVLATIDIMAIDGRAAAAGFLSHGLRVKQVILVFVA